MPVEEHFRLVDVHLDGDDLIIVFRWKRDPNTYAFRYRMPAPQDRREPPSSSSPSTPQDVATEVYGSLQEELDTGLVEGARRVPRRHWVELDWHHRGMESPGYYLGESAAKEWRDVDLRALGNRGRDELVTLGWTAYEPLLRPADEHEDLRRALLAQADTRHPAVVGVLFLDLPAPGAPEPEAEITGLEVLAEHRGQELESWLVDAAVARARVDGALRVSCRTGQVSPALLERLGFTEQDGSWVRGTVDALLADESSQPS